MNRQSINRSVHNSINRQQPNRYKDMNYANHPEKFPLELQGKLKRHSQPHVQESIKSIINYDECNQNKSAVKDENCQNSRIGQNSRNSLSHPNPRNSVNLNSALAEKILSNNKLSSTNYEKSIVPESDSRSSKFRPQSVKTYKQSREGTGLNYIMAADDKSLYKPQQRRHVEEYHVPRRESHGRKCNIDSAKKQHQSSQIVSLMKENIPTQNIQAQNPHHTKKSFSNTYTSSIFGVVHPSTTSKRIQNDIHSSFTKKESVNENPPAKSKYESQNMFKTGTSLGFEYKKNKEIGQQKIMEMVGSQSFWAKKGNTESLRQKRDDWRRSIIVIE